MAWYEYGERIGRIARLTVGCSAIIFDPSGRKILLTQRSDNGRWCLPSGRMDPGETVEEACIREVWEETGLKVKISRLVGIYSTPDRISVYQDGNRWQVVGISFVCVVTGGELGLSHETLAADYFSPEEISRMDVLEPHVERIGDALEESNTVFLK
jgi:8-oxo-dGTP pyrophosphatase MutT (NUDIX family)